MDFYLHIYSVLLPNVNIQCGGDVCHHLHMSEDIKQDNLKVKCSYCVHTVTLCICNQPCSLLFILQCHCISVGPICSVLVERCGCRATIIIGGILSGLGMAASSFAQTMVELYITAGIITGAYITFTKTVV